jgi:hypothetical protein
MNLQKLINGITIFTTTIIVLTIGIVYFVYNRNLSSPNSCSIPTPVFFCGTKNISENAQEGKHIFNSYCAACHKLDAKATGPALRSIDSVKFWKWITPKNVKIDTTKFEQLGIEYHQSYFVKELTKEDLENIYEYIR